MISRVISFRALWVVPIPKVSLVLSGFFKVFLIL